MIKDDLKKHDLPDTPGVYFFLDAQKKILYIGKATSLRSRVRSYFASDLHEKRSPLIAQMVDEAVLIEWTETDSVLEALILETNLIRTHKPKYNTRSKDDKSYNHLIITNEEFPRVLVVRERDISEHFLEKDIKHQFGPFPNGQLLREALNIVRRLFKFYDTKAPVNNHKSRFARGKLDFNRQIGLYPEKTDRAQYQRTIRHLRLFFQGRKKQVIKELRQDMMQFAKAEAFEAAERCKRQIFALEHIQDIALIKQDLASSALDSRMRIEAYDIAHMAGKHMVGVMTVVADGAAQKHEYRKFKIRTLKSANDPAALQEILRRRLNHKDWPLPNIIVVDGNFIQKNAAQKVLHEFGVDIPIVAVVKNQQHKPERLEGQAELLRRYQLEILLANNEAHRFAINFHRQQSRQLGI